MMFRYQQIRIALLTFAFGLASVWFINGSKNGLIEVPVNLPQTRSGEIIVVFPRYSSEISHDVGASGGSRNEDRSKPDH